MDPNVRQMLTSSVCNLNGTQLKVAVNIDLPYCDLGYDSDGKYVMKKSIEFNMIKLMANRFNFTIELVYANQSWGSLQNGVWMGSVGHLYNKTADLAICDLTRNSERSKAVDFTKAYITVPVTFVATKPGLKSRTWITITPFSTNVWLAIVMTFIITTLFLQYIYRIKHPGANRVDSISITLFGTLLQQSIIIIDSKYLSLRLIICLWLMSTMILMKTYSGIFFSILTVPEYDEPIESLDDLVRASKLADRYSVITVPNSAYFDLFVRSSCCSDYYYIGKNINKTSRELLMPGSTNTGIDRINEGGGGQGAAKRNVIFIYTSVPIFYGIRKYAKVEMHVSSETLMMDQMAMALQKGSPLLRSMNKAIEQFTENGLFDNWMTETMNAVGGGGGGGGGGGHTDNNSPIIKTNQIES
ncbi:glutamate receptor ionotropic, delta-1-like [Oppia nitens]|uniref:glutamate receptor ionotropic, delta-1-like n=1 Tax=Oppia nitens TaxID=1686743 RepID=UPI0023DB41B5|nr:glutamate receptor ionotropic, delta-1-like [Oppia nitens]